MTDIRLFGYSDPLSAKAGEPIDFMISAEGTNTANAEISRLIHGDYNKEGPGFVEETINIAIIYSCLEQFGVDMPGKEQPRCR